MVVSCQKQILCFIPLKMAEKLCLPVQLRDS